MMMTSKHDEPVFAAPGLRVSQWRPSDSLAQPEQTLLGHALAGMRLDLAGDGPVAHKAMDERGPELLQRCRQRRPGWRPGQVGIAAQAAWTVGPPRTRPCRMDQSCGALLAARPLHSLRRGNKGAPGRVGASASLDRRGWWAEQALQRPGVGGPGLQQDRAGDAAGGIAQGQGEDQHVVQRADDGEELW